MRLYEDRPAGTVDRARLLRRDASVPERRLLRALRRSFPDRKRRHQAPIGPFFADMMCFADRLVIEVDADTHVAVDDARRDAFVAVQGFRTLRFTNAEVMGNLDGALERVSASLGDAQEKGAAA